MFREISLLRIFSIFIYKVWSETNALRKISWNGEKYRWGVCMGTRIGHRTSWIPSSKLLYMKKWPNWQRGQSAFCCYRCRCLESQTDNHQRSLHQEGSGQVPANFQAKSPRLLSQDQFLLKDDAVVHTANSVQDFKSLWRCEADPPFALFARFCPADFFLFWRVKTQLVSVSLSQESIKTSWDWVIQTIDKDKVAAAIWRLMDRCEQSVWISKDQA